MNIQIFGKSKCFDTKKAERYFKERKIKFQSIDIIKYGISRGEFQSVKSFVGGIKVLIDEKSKAYEGENIEYLRSEEVIQEKILNNPSLLKTPIVRNGKKATVGYHPEVWETWE